MSQSRKAAPTVLDVYGKLAEACDDVGRQRRNEDFLAYGRRVVDRFRPIMEAFAAECAARERAREEKTP